MNMIGIISIFIALKSLLSDTLNLIKIPNFDNRKTMVKRIYSI